MCLGKIAVIFPKILPKTHTSAEIASYAFVMETGLVKIGLSISKFYAKCTRYFKYVIVLGAPLSQYYI